MKEIENEGKNVPVRKNNERPMKRIKEMNNTTTNEMKNKLLAKMCLKK